MFEHSKTTIQLPVFDSLEFQSHAWISCFRLNHVIINIIDIFRKEFFIKR